MADEAKNVSDSSGPVATTVEEVDEISRKISLKVPQEHIKQRYNQTLNQFKGQASVKGFRKGKAPQQLLEKMYGPRAKAMLLEEFVRDGLRQASEEHNLNMVGQPDLDISDLDVSKDFECSMTVSIYPEPELKDYDSFDVEVEKKEVSDEDLDNVINRILDSKATIKELEAQPIAEGHLVAAKMQLVGADEEAPFEPFHTTVGDGQIPEQLEQGLVGLKPGEEKEIEVNFPEDHPNESLRGATNTYRVLVDTVSEKTLPELTDALVKSLGYPNVETVIELKLDVRKRLEEEEQQDTKHRVRAAILEQLIERNDFKVPQPLIDDEIKSILASSGFVDPQKVDVRQIDVTPFREHFMEDASKRVKMTVAVDRLSEVLECKASDDDINEHIEKLSEQHGVPVEEVKKFVLGKEQALQTFVDVTRDKVLSTLEERAKVKYTTPAKAA